ncbi:MAG: thiol reductant ABC exporter subunit CydD [Xanthomonadaceae bacterium]|nr:thiol reductant ABC exporter subunit CydD [Xanthomonadaceae bacterium]
MPAPDWLRDRSRSVRPLLGAAIAASAANALALIAQAALLASALNDAIFAHASARALLPALLGFVLLGGARLGLTVLTRRCGFNAGRRVVTAVRSELLAQVQRLGPQWLARQSSGDLITRLVDGVDQLAAYFARYLPQRAFAVVLPLAILAAAFPADWVTGLVLLLTAPLVPLFMLLLGHAAERASQRRWTALTRLGAHFLDALQGLVTLRLFGAGAREQALLAASSEAYRSETMAVLRVAFLSSLVLEFFATVSIAVIAVLVGFRLLWGDLHFFNGLFVLLLAPEFFLPLRTLGTLRHARMDALAVAASVQQILAEPVPARARGGGRVAQAPIAIAFEGVDYAHAPGRPALAGLDLRIAAGRTLAVVGDSGAGKSTLLTLLLGFARPQRGRIRINGIDLADLDLERWRQQLAWVPQRPHVFAGSVRDNLRIARADADALALQRAAAAAGLDAIIGQLPQGWDTPLGEHGHGLSGGQVQRLALARAFLRDAPVLLLDEPTQHLDAAAGAAIAEALARLGHGRTVLAIAHRMQHARVADAIAVLQSGRVVEHGTHAELLAAGAAYARLVRADQAA